jgi:hypothetical protein
VQSPSHHSTSEESQVVSGWIIENVDQSDSDIYVVGTICSTLMSCVHEIYMCCVYEIILCTRANKFTHNFLALSFQLRSIAVPVCTSHYCLLFSVILWLIIGLSLITSLNFHALPPIQHLSRTSIAMKPISWPNHLHLFPLKLCLQTPSYFLSPRRRCVHQRRGEKLVHIVMSMYSSLVIIIAFSAKLITPIVPTQKAQMGPSSVNHS